MSGRTATDGYKVLAADGTSYHGGTGRWTKGRWRSVRGDLEPCVRGIHYCRRDQLVYWLGPAIWVFEDGTPDETIDAGDKLVTRRGRVVQRLERWSDTTARLFAADCAEAVLYLIPESHREPFMEAIQAARLFARGEIDAAARAAADAAADAAAHVAAYAAADAAAARAAADAAARAAAHAAAGRLAGHAAADAAAHVAACAAARAAAHAAAHAAADAARAEQTVLLFDYLDGRRA